MRNYIPDNARSGNFSSVYRMVVNWEDTAPKSSNSSDLSFNVTISNTSASESGNGTLGDLQSYRVSLGNKNATRPLGLTVVVFRPPSCYQLNFDLFETLRAQGVIDDYEFKQGNTEAWLYVNTIPAGQTIQCKAPYQSEIRSTDPEPQVDQQGNSSEQQRRPRFCTRIGRIGKIEEHGFIDQFETEEIAGHHQQ